MLSCRLAACSTVLLTIVISVPTLWAQSTLPPWSVRMADSELKRHSDPMLQDADKPKWDYTQGLIFSAMLATGQATGDQRYWTYAKTYYDGMIDAEGRIRTYDLREFNLDRLNSGKALMVINAQAPDPRYRKALDQLRQQLREHPRTSEGGFWHKERYPSQMWLDGLYMGATFLAQYAATFSEPSAFDDVITQFVLMEKHARDPKTGLLYHAWDEKRAQKWANATTGLSPNFWGRAVGWYGMALVDTLDSVPASHPRRGELVAILRRLAQAVVQVQDPESGLWYQVLDQGSREGNYLEASVSTMLAYTLLKGSRMGYLGPEFAVAGRKAYDGILREFIQVDPDGLVSITRVCQVAGLGNDPGRGVYRDGTFEYYVQERRRDNDPKAVGPFILASLEAERAAR